MSEADLRAKLEALKAGRVPQEELCSTLHDFGEANFRDAEPQVAQYLAHPNENVRYTAVNVLALHWKSPEHIATLQRMLFEDADSDVRRVAATGLGAILKGSRDVRTSRLLIRRLRDSDENRFVREAAYEALVDVAVPPSSKAWGRARASVDRFMKSVREREREIDENDLRGESFREATARLQGDIDGWIDWELVGAIERDEVS